MKRTKKTAKKRAKRKSTAPAPIKREKHLKARTNKATTKTKKRRATKGVRPASKTKRPKKTPKPKVTKPRAWKRGAGRNQAGFKVTTIRFDPPQWRWLRHRAANRAAKAGTRTDASVIVRELVTEAMKRRPLPKPKPRVKVKKVTAKVRPPKRRTRK